MTCRIPGTSRDRRPNRAARITSPDSIGNFFRAGAFFACGDHCGVLSRMRPRGFGVTGHMNQGQLTGSGPRRRRLGKPLSVLALWAAAAVGFVAAPVRAEGPATKPSETTAKAPATQPAFLKPRDAKDL